VPGRLFRAQSRQRRQGRRAIQPCCLSARSYASVFPRTLVVGWWTYCIRRADCPVKTGALRCIERIAPAINSSLIDMRTVLFPFQDCRNGLGHPLAIRLAPTAGSTSASIRSYWPSCRVFQNTASACSAAGLRIVEGNFSGVNSTADCEQPVTKLTMSAHSHQIFLFIV